MNPEKPEAYASPSRSNPGCFFSDPSQPGLRMRIVRQRLNVSKSIRLRSGSETHPMLSHSESAETP